MFRDRLDLTTKICTFPFTQIEMYRKDYLEELSKKQDISKYRKYYDKTFMREIYPNLNANHRINNLDEIDLLFEKFYPRKELSKNNINKYYMKNLSKLSKSFITQRNGKIAFKYWESENEEDFIGPYSGINKIAFWSSLNRIFTTDLLVCRYLLDNGMQEEQYLQGYYFSVMLEDIQLEQILKRGLSETHIHRNTSINFYISWQNLMDMTGKIESDYDSTLFDNKILGKNIDLSNYVKAIAICRVIMADHINNEFSKNLYDRLHNISDDENDYDNEIIAMLLDSIYEGNYINDKMYDFESIWNYLIKEFNLNRDYDISKPVEIKRDILNNIFDEFGYIKTSMENIFIFKCMKYMDKNEDDIYFSKLFFQYIRIKNEVYQNKVQGNLIKGLRHFKDYFNRAKLYRKVSNNKSKYSYKNALTEEEYWRLLIESQLQNENLHKLELRAGIINDSDENIRNFIVDTLKNFLQAYVNVLENIKNDKYRDKIPQVGLVFHLSKMIDVRQPEKCWVNYLDKTSDENELHFGQHRKIYQRQVNALNHIREQYPQLSEFIVGLDAASSENDTEPWVFAPIYDNARCSKNKLLDNNLRIKTLGFTFHAGEDFRHILTGLRRVDEVITHFKFHAGDRIGHAISLGLDIEKWMRNNQVVVLPRMEYLENMLWVWGLYKDGFYDKSFDITYLEIEIMKTAKKIYGKIEGISIYLLWDAYVSKFKEFKPNKSLVNDKEKENCSLFCMYGKSTEVWNEEKLRHVQHCKCYLDRMIEPIQVKVNLDQVNMIKQIQKIVCSKVSREAIIIETNPSSNIVIGEVESLFEHYIYSLNKRGLSDTADTESSIMVSINSDNPFVCNTNISNEFSYIFYALQEKGHSRERILEWIDKVRQYGIDSSFIENRRIDNLNDYIEELKDLINKITRY